MSCSDDDSYSNVSIACVQLLLGHCKSVFIMRQQLTEHFHFKERGRAILTHAKERVSKLHADEGMHAHYISACWLPEGVRPTPVSHN